jgi:hypothetical protein
MEPGEPFGGWPRILRITLFFTLVGLWSARVHRRAAARDLLPRKQRLEALLKELDTP